METRKTRHMRFGSSKSQHLQTSHANRWSALYRDVVAKTVNGYARRGFMQNAWRSSKLRHYRNLKLILSETVSISLLDNQDYD